MRRLPVAGRFFERGNCGRVGGAFAQPGDRFEGLQRFAGFEHGPDFGEGQADQNVAESGDARIDRGGERLNAVEVFPGGFDVVVSEGALGPVDVAANDVASQGPDLAVPGGDEAFQQAVRLLGAAVLQGLPGLVLHHPRRFAHGSDPVRPDR